MPRNNSITYELSIPITGGEIPVIRTINSSYAINPIIYNCGIPKPMRSVYVKNYYTLDDNIILEAVVSTPLPTTPSTNRGIYLDYVSQVEIDDYDNYIKILRNCKHRIIVPNPPDNIGDVATILFLLNNRTGDISPIDMRDSPDTTISRHDNILIFTKDGVKYIEVPNPDFTILPVYFMLTLSGLLSSYIVSNDSPITLDNALPVTRLGTSPLYNISNLISYLMLRCGISMEQSMGIIRKLVRYLRKEYSDIYKEDITSVVIDIDTV